MIEAPAGPTFSSDVAVLAPAGRAAPGAGRARSAAAERPWVRLAAFVALALYGVLRWRTLLNPAPTWRLLGLLALAVAVAAVGPLLGRRTRVLPLLALGVAVIGVLAICGLPLGWIWDVRIAVSARAIGSGLSALPRVLVPYLGINPWIRTVTLLGAGLLLLAGAAPLALARGRPADLRRAAAVAPLIALAIVPQTLVAPKLPYLQGLLLFLLVAMFLWGEELAAAEVPIAVGLGLAAAAVAMIAAPAVRAGTPWLDYQALAGNLAPSHLESFDWTQSYGPLHWPRNSVEVLDVQASRGDYWKAENLDVFDGTAWVDGSVSAPDPMFTVSRANISHWTLAMRVTIHSMRTRDVIGAGASAAPTHVSGVVAGFSNGTWGDSSGLGPGDSYEIRSYDPDPSAAQLEDAGSGYPSVLLPAYLSLGVPVRASSGLPPVPGTLPPPPAVTQVVFPPYGSSTTAAYGSSFVTDVAAIRRSPYARAYALVRRLTRGTRTPYDYVSRVERYLSGANGFRYDENPARSRYPLAAFLFGSRHGYCQQFAGTMALLLRMGGVPARVATGFTSGTYDDATRSWVVTDTDAHAWVEAWFPRFGWVRFDPTPYAAPARGGHLSLPSIGGAGGIGAAATPGKHGLSRGAGGSGSSPTSHRAGSGVGGPLVLAIVLALAAVALLATIRLRDPTAEEVLGELERAFRRCRRPLGSAMTLAALEQRLRGDPDAQAYVRDLRLARFAGVAWQPSGAGRRALRAHLRRGLGLPGRIRALWALPPRVRPRLPLAGGAGWGINSR